jgi:hypothetical protein
MVEQDEKSVEYFTKILAEQDIKVLLKAKQTIQIKINNDPGDRKSLKALSDINKQISELTAGRQAESEAQPKAAGFDNLLQALAWLQGQGYKLKKTKIYKDKDRGLLKIQQDGRVLESDVRAYAEQYLFREGVDGSSLTDQKTKKEIERLILRIDREKYDFEKDQGKYIARDELSMEFAARALAFDAGIKSDFTAKVFDLIKICGGDPEKSKSIIDFISDLLDRRFRELARVDRFQVIFNDGQGSGHADN